MVVGFVLFLGVFGKGYGQLRERLNIVSLKFSRIGIMS